MKRYFAYGLAAGYLGGVIQDHGVLQGWLQDRDPASNTVPYAVVITGTGTTSSAGTLSVHHSVMIPNLISGEEIAAGPVEPLGAAKRGLSRKS